MRYLEFSTSKIILEVSTAIVNQYRLVEAITDEKMQAILQRVNQILIREIGTNPRPTTLRSVLSAHGFKKNTINQILAGIDAPGTIDDVKSTKDSNPSTEEPDSGENTTVDEPTQSTTTHAHTSPSQPSIKVSDDIAKEELKKLANPYPGLDQNTEDKLRSIARSAISLVGSDDSSKVLDALNSQLELINQEINKLEPKTETVYETSSSGGTSAGSVASVSAPLGAVIKRMPPGQSFFAPMVAQKTKKTVRKKSKKR